MQSGILGITSLICKHMGNYFPHRLVHSITVLDAVERCAATLGMASPAKARLPLREVRPEKARQDTGFQPGDLGCAVVAWPGQRNR